MCERVCACVCVCIFSNSEAGTAQGITLLCMCDTLRAIGAAFPMFVCRFYVCVTVCICMYVYSAMVRQVRHMVLRAIGAAFPARLGESNGPIEELVQDIHSQVCLCLCLCLCLCRV